LLQFAFELLGQGRHPTSSPATCCNQMPALGRADLFVTLRGMLDAQTFLFATFDSTPVPLIRANRRPGTSPRPGSAGRPSAGGSA
jgi:hypothetical protein